MLQDSYPSLWSSVWRLEDVLLHLKKDSQAHAFYLQVESEGCLSETLVPEANWCLGDEQQ